MYFIFLLSISFFVGVVGVSSNPSSCFAASALIVAAGFGCGLLAELGGFFLAVVLFLVYLGGMLVVFAYSVALSFDPHPEAWWMNLTFVFVACYYLLLGFVVVWSGHVVGFEDIFSMMVIGEDGNIGLVGVCLLYGAGGWSLMIISFGLLLTLFVVLELVRSVCFGALK